MSSYKLIWVSGLKYEGNSVTIIFEVNGWLLFMQVDHGWEAYVGVILVTRWNRLYSS